MDYVMNGHIAFPILDHVAPRPSTTNTIDVEKVNISISTTANNQRSRLVNLQTIHSQTSHPPSSDVLPTSNDNTNNNNVAIYIQMGGPQPHNIIRCTLETQ
eukprot:1106354_1